MVFDFKNLPADFFANPYPYYAQLRQENPVYPLPDGGFFLTEYTMVNRVYRDTANFSSDKKLQFGPLFGTDSPLYEHHTPVWCSMTHLYTPTLERRLGMPCPDVWCKRYSQTWKFLLDVC